MTALTAALSLGDGQFYEAPHSAQATAGLRVLGAGPIGQRTSVRCCTAAADGRAALITVRKGKG